LSPGSPKLTLGGIKIARSAAADHNKIPRSRNRPGFPVSQCSRSTLICRHRPFANVGHVLLRQNFDLGAVELVTASKAKKITRIVDGKIGLAVTAGGDQLAIGGRR
jgi:hypothetical protein